jgi:hypothetical protein
MTRPRPPRSLTAGALLLAASGLGAASPALDAPAPAYDLPIREVTVFSDRARVSRRAEVALEAGERKVRLPLLPVTADPASVRLEAQGARVVRLELSPAERSDFPRSEARQLVEAIERLRDEEQGLRDELAPLERERALLLGMRPDPAPPAVPGLATAPLEASGWKASLAFVEARDAAIQASMAPVEQKLREKQRELATVVERARRLAADETSRPGTRVEAVLERLRPQATLTLTYMARGARWYPAYDVRATPGEASVDVELAGLVAQETGEDWPDARLVLSTAVPAVAPALPKLLTWKISDRERFVPTPRPAPETSPAQPRPAVRAPAPEPLATRDDEDARLRERLYELVGEAPSRPPPPPPPPSMSGGARPRSKSQAAMPRPAPMPSAKAMAAPAPMAPPAAESADEAMPVMEAEATSARRSEPAARVTPMPFGAPRGWQPPSFAADLPASLSGGYDFTFASTRPETIGSGRGPQRVAVGSRKLPASTRLQVFPALRREAFSVAEVTNTGDTPLLGGRAQLFSGADLQGTAQLPTTAAGEKVTLPLGVDEAIGVQRNVRTIEGERGVFGKQDVGTYEVVIELLNPRARPVQMQVRDQVPLSGDKDHVEVRLESAEPGAKPDPATGLLEWSLELAPGQKRTLSFRYTVARPRGWKPTEQHLPLETGR